MVASSSLDDDSNLHLRCYLLTRYCKYFINLSDKIDESDVGGIPEYSRYERKSL